MESRVAVTWRDHSPDGCVPTQEGRRLIEQTVPFLTSVIVARKLVLHSNRNRRPCVRTEVAVAEVEGAVAVAEVETAWGAVAEVAGGAAGAGASRRRSSSKINSRSQ